MSKPKTICEQCGKTFQMTYEAPSCSKLSNNWISIDTSPIKDGEYLIVAFDKDGDAYYGIADYFVDHDESISWSIDTVFIKQSDITHWMPLPSCPEIPDNSSEIPKSSQPRR